METARHRILRLAFKQRRGTPRPTAITMLICLFCFACGWGPPPEPGEGPRLLRADPFECQEPVDIIRHPYCRRDETGKVAPRMNAMP